MKYSAFYKDLIKTEKQNWKYNIKLTTLNDEKEKRMFNYKFKTNLKTFQNNIFNINRIQGRNILNFN